MAPPGKLKLTLFGALGLPLSFATYPLLIYLPTFYGKDMGLGLAAVGMVFLLIRFWDGFTDPLVGLLSDRLHLPLGRRRPWLLLGAPLACVAIHRLFAPPEHVTVFYLFSWSLAFYFGWTLLIVPYNAWAAELSDEYHERTRVSAYVHLFTAMGPVAAAVIVYFTGSDTRLALKTMAWCMIISLPILTLASVFTVQDVNSSKQMLLSGVREQLIVSLKNKPLRTLLSAQICNGVGNALPATLVLLYIEHVLNRKAQVGLFLGSLFMATIIGVVLWYLYSRGREKHKVWRLSILLSCFTFILVPVISLFHFEGAAQFGLYLYVCIVSGLTFGGDAVLPQAMHADVVDVESSQTGFSGTGYYFALWGIANKLAQAVPVGLAFPLLSYFGFKPDGPNSSHALWFLTLLYSTLPIAFKLMAVFFINRYKLDEKKQKHYRELKHATYYLD